MPAVLTDAELDGLIAYWEAANYLTVAQIYLQDNALVREPVRAEHIKPRLLGHWGSSRTTAAPCWLATTDTSASTSRTCPRFVNGPGRLTEIVTASPALDLAGAARQPVAEGWWV